MKSDSSASAVSARPDASCTNANKLHYAQLPRALSPRIPSFQRQDQRARTPIRCSRALGAFVLATAIFTLAALSGPDLIGHLLGAGDADHCPVCAAVHGMRAGASMATVVLVPALFLVGPPTLRWQSSVPAVSIPAPASRAPPAIA